MAPPGGLSWRDKAASGLNGNGVFLGSRIVREALSRDPATLRVAIPWVMGVGTGSPAPTPLSRASGRPLIAASCPSTDPPRPAPPESQDPEIPRFQDRREDHLGILEF